MANLVFDVCFANRVTLVSGEEVVLSVRFSLYFACIILKSVNMFEMGWNQGSCYLFVAL